MTTRIKGIIRLLAIGLRVFCLVEFRVREALQAKDEKLDHLDAGNPNRSTAKRTTEMMLRTFTCISLIVVSLGGTDWHSMTPLNAVQSRTVDLLGFSGIIYQGMGMQSEDGLSKWANRERSLRQSDSDPLSGRTRNAPQIGFDRSIPLDWAACALRMRSGTASPDALDALLDQAELGEPTKKKIRSFLKGLWLEPRAELEIFAQRGAEIAQETPAVRTSTLCWGMAVAAYPFFGKVAEIIGRLTAIQGDCAAVQIHRRMAEIYGEGEVTRRASSRVIQTQASWNAIKRVDQGRRIVRRSPLSIVHDTLTVWLVEAAIRYTRRRLPVTSLYSAAILYPFAFEHSLSYAISTSGTLELRAEGMGSQVVMIL